jgi:hypothetical protein
MVGLQGLAHVDLGTAGFPGAWETLARLQAQQGDWQVATATAKKGLRNVTAAGQNPMDAAILGNACAHVVRRLRLVMGQALLELGQGNEAEPIFRRVLGTAMC